MDFKSTCIYIKTCNHCGLKYFGKSTQKNVNKYKGSGTYWKNHLKKHKCNFKTFIIKNFNNKQQCMDFCMWFSTINNIVKSNKWANLTDETGIGGGTVKGEKHHYYGKKRSKEVRLKISNTLQGFNHSKETRENMSKNRMGINNSMYGKKHSEETKQKMRKPKSEEHKQKLRKQKPKYKCNYCKKEIGGKGNLKQHEKKCKIL